MRSLFGFGSDCCGKCSNLVRVQTGNGHKYKCAAYGITNSEATDWKKNAMACGLLNKSLEGFTPVFKRFHERQKSEQIEGQLNISDFGV